MSVPDFVSWIESSPDVPVTTSGEAAIQLEGKVNQLAVTLSGTGAYNSQNLECKRATVTNTGGTPTGLETGFDQSGCQTFGL